jgi:formylglycine-generating enzyme required for sulfatase activity
MRFGHLLGIVALSASLANGEASAPEKGAAKVNPLGGETYVWIPAGKFQMGCSNGDTDCRHDHGLVTKRDDAESPAHAVTISKGFWLGKTPVTVGAYKKFAAAKTLAMPPADLTNPGWKAENHPMVNMGWNDAVSYCAWASGRLPTEAEWEYAARGGSTAARYGELDAVAWYKANSAAGRGGPGTHPVATKQANGFGLYDMLGNVEEWTSDWYDAGYYAQSPAADPQGPATGKYRVQRGGSWFDMAANIRVSQRNPEAVGNKYDWFGLRCVWEPK